MESESRLQRVEFGMESEMEAENVDSSLEKQGYMGERREREISSYERRWHLHFGWRRPDIYRLKAETKGKVEDAGERRWIQVVKRREDETQSAGAGVYLQGEAGGRELEVKGAPQFSPFPIK